MNLLDYVVLIGSILGIAVYGVWQTQNRNDLQSYLKGKKQTPWLTIGLSVMATQASAITFLSTPGQGYLGGFRASVFRCTNGADIHLDVFSSNIPAPERLHSV